MLNENTIAALVCLCRNGAVMPGANGWSGGGVRVVRASTIRALARRGLCVLATSPDGDVMGVRP